MTLYNQTSGDSKSFSRLPKNVQPSHYSITLKTNLTNFTFTGQEVIRVKVDAAVDNIVINCLDIKVNTASYKSHDGKELKAAECLTNDETELLTLKFGNQLPIGNGELSIDFVGNLNDKMKGFYRCKTITADKKEKYSAVTQFEPTDARRAFPCWDEPAIKAQFDMTLVVPKDKTAISNMPVINEEADVDPEYKIVKFDTSPIMSTYLVAAAVGEYDYLEDTSADGVNVRVYTQPTKKEQGRLALEVGVRALPFYKDYFGIAYPLPKMDFLAVPDFSAGAMENWGLVTYREARLLFDPDHTSAARKQSIPLVVGHELAHQWFGNLVTMEWWTSLWLNEGFAKFMEFLCVDNLYPEYGVWTQFVSGIHNNALDLDGLHNSHPIEVPVGNPSEIDEIFDVISYCKGASVIRMLYRYIGDEAFKKGLHEYLLKFSYKNALTEDLWTSFEESSKKPVSNVMCSWIKQKGYPVITVKAEQVGNDRVLTLSQEKFCSNGKPCESDKNTIWSIPIAVCTQSNPNVEAAQTLLETKTGQLVVRNVKPNEWVKLNPGTVGVYRVHYPTEILSQFYASIENKELPPLDRLGIQIDLFAMVQSGRVSAVEILKLMRAFVNEDNYTVWSSVNASFGKLHSLLSHTNFYIDFQAYGRSLFANIVLKLGYDPKEDEDHLNKLLRTLVLGRLATLEDEMMTMEAKKRFEAHYNGKQLIPADIRGAIYDAVAVNCDDTTFERLFELYRKADLHDEKNRLLSSICFVKDEARIHKVLDFILSGEVRDQDIIHGWASVTSSKIGRELAWRFFQKESETFKTRCSSGFLIGHIVKCCTKGFASEEKAKEVEIFFATHPIPATERTVQQSIESIRLSADWLARDSQAIEAYLNSNYV